MIDSFFLCVIRSVVGWIVFMDDSRYWIHFGSSEVRGELVKDGCVLTIFSNRNDSRSSRS